MGNMMLTIEHNGRIFEPPIEEDVQIEWERTGAPGKLTFTTLKTGDDMAFQHGDKVCFYYENATSPIFVGYVFTKKRDKEQRIKVTCYDQLRYLKNKYTYVFENKTATEIIKALCADFGLNTKGMEDTRYIIPSIAEENTAAIDIAMMVLEETLLNTGEMYVLYDDAGTVKVKNCANMVSSTIIMKDTAENYDYSSSIDDETYNSVVLYYVEENNAVSVYTASSNQRIKEWGTLRYFEEVKNKTIAQNKAKAILDLYCKKTRELTVSGAFGDITVRGGTLIPVNLDLGDLITSNYMLVDKVTHKFNYDRYTMDLTLVGEWEDTKFDVQTSAIDNTPPIAITPHDNTNTTNDAIDGTTSTTIATAATNDIKFTVNFQDLSRYSYYDYLSYSTKQVPKYICSLVVVENYKDQREYILRRNAGEPIHSTISRDYTFDKSTVTSIELWIKSIPDDSVNPSKITANVTFSDGITYSKITNKVYKLNLGKLESGNHIVTVTCGEGEK